MEKKKKFKKLHVIIWVNRVNFYPIVSFENVEFIQPKKID